MRKPEIEIVKFDSSDVIATSGKIPSLTVSNFKDGTQNNLEVDFNGEVHSNYNSLKGALDAAGLTIYTDTNPGSGSKNFDTYFQYDSQLDGTSNQYLLNDKVNGTYTWFDTERKWKHN